MEIELTQNEGLTVSAATERYHGNPFGAIRGIDYTVIFVRDMRAMTDFYRDVMGFPVYFSMGDDWIEHRVGSNVLALCRPAPMMNAATPPMGEASLQLAFRVRHEQVDACARALESAGIALISPPTNQSWGHRTSSFAIRMPTCSNSTPTSDASAARLAQRARRR